MESSSSSSSSSSSCGTSLDHSNLEAGFCECTVKTHRLCTRSHRRRAVVSSGMRMYESRFFYDAFDDSHAVGDGAAHHFLDACFLCKKPLAGNRDIFMYRGDMPFCSEECRQVQIERDETKEKNSKYSVRATTSGKPEQQQQQQQKQNSQRIPVSAW